MQPLSDTRAWTNIIPKQMTRRELMSGYLRLVERLSDWSHFEARVKGMISLIRRQPKVKPRGTAWDPSLGVLIAVFTRMYGACEWKAPARRGKLRWIPSIG